MSYEGAFIPPAVFLEKGEQVKLVGEITETNVFRADEVRPWGGRQHRKRMKERMEKGFKKTIFSFAIVLFLSSCGGPTDPIESNNGGKWKINAEMMPHLEASEKLISVFASNDKKDFKTLKLFKNSE